MVIDAGGAAATPEPLAGRVQPAAGHVLCLINEAWFFRSHFLPWALAARAAGFDVSVLGAPEAGAGGTDDGGVSFLPSSARRAGWRPQGLWAAARELRDLADRLDVSVVHVFGLHGMAIAALARLAGLRLPLVVSVTGTGFLATTRGPVRFAARAGAALTARLLDAGGPVWLCENRDDAAVLRLGRANREGRVTILTGAGVDTARFVPAPLPERPPLKLILVARMVRSKGVDLAVAAVTRARGGGLDVTLSLVGSPDPANPRALGAEELAAFARTEGVSHLGRRSDIEQLLGTHHAFILPSRGGEGLPKALLEAAAAGRPAIVTDVPGCRDFVVDGEGGFVVPAEDVEALAVAIERAGRSDLAAMGAKARAAVERSATVAQVSAAVVEVYRRLAGRAGAPIT
ncbi:MAG: glycosyltransferase [Phreatobacter sp.]|uniref:glycosyltransferase n=1 Tax=Phreatobacter sp. TaxID=1966341 RepID=UPI0027344721|nr:glycosyltransferase [Phreatobacter sp.]MDP2804055.1 glycosyltransferase [Phreatobacter sp.]